MPIQALQANKGCLKVICDHLPQIASLITLYPAARHLFLDFEMIFLSFLRLLIFVRSLANPNLRPLLYFFVHARSFYALEIRTRITIKRMCDSIFPSIRVSRRHLIQEARSQS